jgi:hypothetical protein
MEMERVGFGNSRILEKRRFEIEMVREERRNIIV